MGHEYRLDGRPAQKRKPPPKSQLLPGIRDNAAQISRVESYSYTHYSNLPFPCQAPQRKNFSNEQGFASYQRLLGVVFVDDGTVYSVHDQFTERSLLFLAEDFTELMPLTLSSLYQPNDAGTGNPVNPLGNSTSVTPSSVWQSIASSN